jgi:hypothetical protein
MAEGADERARGVVDAPDAVRALAADVEIASWPKTAPSGVLIPPLPLVTKTPRSVPVVQGKFASGCMLSAAVLALRSKDSGVWLFRRETVIAAVHPAFAAVSAPKFYGSTTPR